MTMTRKRWRSPWVLVCLLMVPLIGAPIYFSSRRPVDLPHADDAQPITGRVRSVTMGGVPRPASDWPAGRSSLSPADETMMAVALRPRVRPLQPDANAAAASVHEAASGLSHPQRLSPMVMPKPFDRKAYRADSDSYLSVHEPGRIWQSAQPGDGVPVLERVGRRFEIVRQGESLRLRVKTEAWMPVTFASFDLGTFDNGLTVITVAAGDDGVAETAFHGAGVVGHVHILAASPVAAERVAFEVRVTPPPSRSSQARTMP